MILQQQWYNLVFFHRSIIPLDFLLTCLQTRDCAVCHMTKKARSCIAAKWGKNTLLVKYAFLFLKKNNILCILKVTKYVPCSFSKE